MKHLLLFQIIILNSLFLASQSSTSYIEGQIIGYKGKGTLNYSLKEFYGGTYNASTPIDSLGRFSISTQKDKIQFFVLFYKQDSLTHTCRIIVEPGTHYSFISKGIDSEEWKTNYSPIIYRSNKTNDFNSANFYLDKGSMFYNLIDNGTRGHLYQHEWNLNNPDSLLPVLEKKSVMESILLTNY